MEINKHEVDGCQVCLGTKGGVKGNENRVAGLVVCDYCSVAMDKTVLSSPPPPRTFVQARAHNSSIWQGQVCYVKDCFYCEAAKHEAE